MGIVKTRDYGSDIDYIYIHVQDNKLIRSSYSFVYDACKGFANAMDSFRYLGSKRPKDLEFPDTS